MPDKCSVEDIMYELNVISQVHEGLNDADNGKIISTEDLLKRIEKWSK